MECVVRVGAVGTGIGEWVDDPIEAAEHLGVLVTSAVNNRSLFGTVDIDDEEIDRLVAGGVNAFLRAYRPTDARP